MTEANEKNMSFDQNPFCFSQPPVARREPSAVTLAQKLKRADSKTESHTNGSEVQATITPVSPQVNHCPCIGTASDWISTYKWKVQSFKGALGCWIFKRSISAPTFYLSFSECTLSAVLRMTSYVDISHMSCIDTVIPVEGDKTCPSCLFLHGEQRQDLTAAVNMSRRPFALRVKEKRAIGGWP